MHYTPLNCQWAVQTTAVVNNTVTDPRARDRLPGNWDMTTVSESPVQVAVIFGIHCGMG